MERPDLEDQARPSTVRLREIRHCAGWRRAWVQLWNQDGRVGNDLDLSLDPGRFQPFPGCRVAYREIANVLQRSLHCRPVLGWNVERHLDCVPEHRSESGQ